jgi:hypothetical protein
LLCRKLLSHILQALAQPIHLGLVGLSSTLERTALATQSDNFCLHAPHVLERHGCRHGCAFSLARA